MIEFNKLENKKYEIDIFSEETIQIYEDLKQFRDKFPYEIDTIKKIGKDLLIQIKEFYETDRFLRIGVMGQVKAGKSSFLNTLLFDGQEILPKASTPKTANLTKIKYGKENSLEIYFYSLEEWEEIKRRSKSFDDSLEGKVAKEIIDMFGNSDINIEQVLESGCRIIKMNTYDELLGILNEYAGEDGRFTSIVKHLNLNINIMELEGIEIIDTPGLNDPIVSRTQKTKEYMKSTDVVFFLSQSTSFLDASDTDLLVRQLPAKGVSEFILLCSKMDSGILDEGWHYDSYDETMTILLDDLNSHAEETILNKLHGIQYEEVKNNIRKAIPPIFMSSMAENLFNKEEAYYTLEEKSIFDELAYTAQEWNGDFKFTKQTLKQISNFQEIRKKLEIITKSKEDILLEKLNSIIPLAQNSLKDTLTALRDGTSEIITKLENTTYEDLKNEQKSVREKQSGIEYSIEDILGTIQSDLRTSKVEIIAEIRRAMTNNISIEEKTGENHIITTHTVNDAKLFHPSTWGTSHEETNIQVVTYRFVDAGDALDNIMEFANASVSSIEQVILRIVNMDRIRFRLRKSVLENFDAGDYNFEPNYYKLTIDRAVNKIELPVISMEIQSKLNAISNKFSSEVKGSDIGILKQLLVSILNDLFSEITNKANEVFSALNKEIEEMKQGLGYDILQEIMSTLEKLESELKEKAKEITRYKTLINKLEVMGGTNVNN